MLRTENLSVHTPHNRLLHPCLNFEFAPGTITYITGPNGIGKSTLLALLSGIQKPQTGHILLNGRNLAHMSPTQRTQVIASIGQHDTCPTDTLVSRRIGHGFTAANITQIANTAQTLGISHLLDKQLSALSGGERKRVFIARCLINPNASVYILDEPDAGLDSHSQSLLFRAFQGLASQGKIIIFSSHLQPKADDIRTLSLMPQPLFVVEHPL